MNKDTDSGASSGDRSDQSSQLDLNLYFTDGRPKRANRYKKVDTAADVDEILSGRSFGVTEEGKYTPVMRRYNRNSIHHYTNRSDLGATFLGIAKSIVESVQFVIRRTGRKSKTVVGFLLFFIGFLVFSFQLVRILVMALWPYLGAILFLSTMVLMCVGGMLYCVGEYIDARKKIRRRK